MRSGISWTRCTHFCHSDEKNELRLVKSGWPWKSKIESVCAPTMEYERIIFVSYCIVVYRTVRTIIYRSVGDTSTVVRSVDARGVRRVSPSSSIKTIGGPILGYFLINEGSLSTCASFNSPSLTLPRSFSSLYFRLFISSTFPFYLFLSFFHSFLVEVSFRQNYELSSRCVLVR